MELTGLIALGSLAVAIWLAVLRFREYQRDKRLANKAGLQDEVKAPAERDSIIVGGATQAVKLLREALDIAAADLVRLRVDRDAVLQRLSKAEESLTNTRTLNIELAARVAFLEQELTRLTDERNGG